MRASKCQCKWSASHPINRIKHHLINIIIRRRTQDFSSNQELPSSYYNRCIITKASSRRCHLLEHHLLACLTLHLWATSSKEECLQGQCLTLSSQEGRVLGTLLT